MTPQEFEAIKREWNKTGDIHPANMQKLLIAAENWSKTYMIWHRWWNSELTERAVIEAIGLLI